jgi:WD40 repeat protein
VWLAIGKESNISLKELVEYIALALNENFRAYSEVAYRSMMREKSILVVLDDVWTIDDIEPFRMGLCSSQLLYTSRNIDLTGQLGSETYEVGVLPDVQARAFLAKWVARKPSELPEPSGTQVLMQCKGLILGLAMIGAALRAQPDQEWHRMVLILEKAQLKLIDRRTDGYAYETLYASIAASIEWLDSLSKRRYLRLALLLEEMAISEAMLTALWGSNADDAQQTARLLVDRSLASRDAEGNFRLHDFQLDFIRGEHPDPGTLALQHAALLRSMHVLLSHPDQFSSQMIGRLLGFERQPAIAAFIKELDFCAELPRLRLLHPPLEAAGSPVRRVLTGHKRDITAVDISADGRKAISCSQDAVFIWDLGCNDAPELLEAESYSHCVALTPDGRYALTGGLDTTLWDLTSRPAKAQKKFPNKALSEGRWSAISLAMTPDRRLVMWGSEDKGCILLSSADNRDTHVLKGHTDWVRAVAVTPDGKVAVSRSDDGTLLVWYLDYTQPRRLLKGNTRGIAKSVAISSDSRFVVSYGNEDSTYEIQIWDLSVDGPPRTLTSDRYITALAVTPSATRVVAACLDRTLRVWDLTSDEPPRVLFGHSDHPDTVAITADGRLAISGGQDKALRLWDLASSQDQRQFIYHFGSIQCIAMSNDGTLAVSAAFDETLCIWSVDRRDPPKVLKGHRAPIRSVAMSSDGLFIVSGSNDCDVCLWDLAHNDVPRVLSGHTSIVTSVAISANAELAISASADRTLRVWDLVKARSICILEGHSDFVSAVALSPDGKLAISGSHDKTLRVWNLAGSQPSVILEGHTDEIFDVALDGLGRHAISSSSDGTLRYWTLGDNPSSKVFATRVNGAYRIALTGDGRLAAFGTHSGILEVWNLREDRCLRTFTCDAPIISCCWAGAHIAVGDDRGRVSFFLWQE